MRNVCNRFFNDRRAVGTALAAAIFTLMSLAGVALVGDHKHMTTNRDLLKGATNAATIAAVMELDGRSLGALTAGERSALDATARRYILANIKANVSQDTYQQAVDTLSVTLKDTGPGLVDVDASADLGNIVFGRWLWPTVAKTTEVVSRTERIAGITEVALAIDVTSSMYHDPGGIHPTDQEKKADFTQSRIEIVKRAALDLVNTLTADGSGQTAVGLVPWNYLVRLNATTRTRWEDQGWVSYPTQRYYPNPYKDAPNGETHTLPARNGASWWGCVDQRSLCTLRNSADPWDGCLDEYKAAGTSPPGLSLALPSDEPFTMLFYPARTLQPYRLTHTISYQCRANKVQKSCYDESLVPADSRPDQGKLKGSQPGNYYLEDPQHGCWNRGGSEILPLTTDTGTIKRAIQALSARGSNTYSTPGIVWAHRLLAPEWRAVWGANRTHPVGHTDAQKALVLLTDGEDNHVSKYKEHRRHSCQAAKDDGIIVFTIAAMATAEYPGLVDALTNCASKPEYAFINNSTPEALEQAFRDIAAQLLRFRRVM